MFSDYDPERDGVLTQVERNVFMKYIQGIRNEEDQQKIVKAFNNSKNITPLGGYMKTVLELLDESLTEFVLEKVEKESEEKGMKKGMKKGREEGIRTTAKNFRDQGVDIKEISKATGLTEEEINNL